MSSVRPRCQRNARLGLSTDRPARWLRLLAKLTLHFAKLSRRRPGQFLWADVTAQGGGEFGLGDRLFWGTLVAPHWVQTKINSGWFTERHREESHIRHGLD